MSLFVGATQSVGRHIKHKHEFRGMRTPGSKREKEKSMSEALASAIICQRSRMHALYEGMSNNMQKIKVPFSLIILQVRNI